MCAASPQPDGKFPGSEPAGAHKENGRIYGIKIFIFNFQLLQSRPESILCGIFTLSALTPDWPFVSGCRKRVSALSPRHRAELNSISSVTGPDTDRDLKNAVCASRGIRRRTLIRSRSQRSGKFSSGFVLSTLWTRRPLAYVGRK